jgi:hypothetical protein
MKPRPWNSGLVVDRGRIQEYPASGCEGIKMADSRGNTWSDDTGGMGSSMISQEEAVITSLAWTEICFRVT